MACGILRFHTFFADLQVLGVPRTTDHTQGGGFMYKLVIVDDEESTRSGLVECFDWERFGIRVVGEADDGIKGWELIERLQPDIVITDVKMPGMDGIALADRIVRRGKPVKLIFVSGYDDVDLLKSAMKMDAADYILKPIDLAELSSVIGKVVDRTEKERSLRQRMTEMESKLAQSIPLLREKFWTRLIRGAAGYGGELDRQKAFLGFSFPMDGEYCAAIIRLDDQATLFNRMQERDIELISFAVQNICQEIIDSALSGYVFEYNRGEFVSVIALRTEEDRDLLYAVLKEIKEKLCGFLQRFADISLTIGLGEVVSPLTELHDSYRSAGDAVDQKLFLGKNNIITVDRLGNGNNPDHRHVSGLVERVTAILKTADKDRVSRYLQEIFDYLARSRNVNLKYCQMVCLEILIGASKFLIDVNLLNEVLEAEEKRLRDALFGLETLADMKDGVESYLHLVCSHIGCMQKQKSSRLITQVKELIHSRYATNLTIKDMAKEVYLTSTYMCLLFKQETGETINEYLTRLRMEKAKELLRNPDIRLYDICHAIGYAEPGYFSKQFKKYSGFTPSEYRDMVTSS